MKRLGNPQDDLKYVHVAGTNGKGSVIAFLYSTLSEAGYRIGRYVSPTLYSYRGRMEVTGSRINRESYAEERFPRDRDIDLSYNSSRERR